MVGFVDNVIDVVLQMAKFRVVTGHLFFQLLVFLHEQSGLLGLCQFLLFPQFLNDFPLFHVVSLEEIHVFGGLLAR